MHNNVPLYVAEFAVLTCDMHWELYAQYAMTFIVLFINRSYQLMNINTYLDKQLAEPELCH